MLIRLISDTHLDSYTKFVLDISDVDVCVLAGDIAELKQAIPWLIEFANENKNKHIIHVSGNHEYYNSKLMRSDLEAVKAFEKISNLHHLENDSVVINDVKFIGATLWTSVNNSNPLDVQRVWKGLNDYRMIKGSSDIGRVTPYVTTRIHRQSVKYIFSELEKSEEKTVVVTHHKPYASRLDTQRELWSAYASCLDDKFCSCTKLPEYWLYGHTHQQDNTTLDYPNGKVQFISNPYGYPLEDCDYDDRNIISV